MGFEDFIAMSLPRSVGSAASFARAWSQEVPRQCERYRAAHAHFAREMRTAELMDLDVGPNPERTNAAWHQLWTAGHLLLTSADQLIKWLDRHNEEVAESDQVRVESEEVLRYLRNSLEHLYESDIDGDAAVSSNSKQWSLNKLPKKELPLSIHVGTAREKPFGIVDLDLIEKCAAEIEAALDPEHFYDYSDLDG